MAGEVVVDALPYIDQGYDEPGVREAALAMVDEETRRYRPTKNYLEHLPQLNLGGFETEIMKTEFERMQQRQPMDLLSMKRYELPPPPAGKMTDIAAWTECVENSMAQLEHQATRICNLELMLDYGCEAWKSYLETLIQLVLQAQKQLQTVRKQIQETNWQRKNEQLHAGERLRQLEATWVGLVSKNYEIEQACAMLEKEAMRMNHHVAVRGPRREKIREPEIKRSPVKAPARQPVREIIPEVAVPRNEIVQKPVIQEPVREEPVKEVIQETITATETNVEVREVVQETAKETVQEQEMDEEPQIIHESVQETEQVKAIPEKMEVEQDDDTDDKSDEEDSSSSEEESSDDTDSEEEEEDEEEEDEEDKDEDEDSDEDED